MPLAAIAGIGAIGSIGSALIGSHSASSAADKQMQAAQQAAQLQALESQNATNYQNGIYNQTQSNLNPYLNTGIAANSQLGYLLGLNPSSAGMAPNAQSINPTSIGIGKTPTNNAATAVPSLGSMSFSQSPSTPQSGAVGATAPLGGINPTSGGAQLPIGVPRANPVAGVGGVGAPASATTPGGFGSLTQGYGQTFQAPTDITEQNDPGYQARLKLGTDAIQRSAAARGNVLTGGTAKALDSYGQDYASNEYNNVYNRALQTFGTNYGVWNNDQNNIYNRLLGLSNAGQQAGTTLGSLGQSSANNVTQNLLGTGQQIGQDYGAGAAANASGIYNSGAAWQNGLNGLTGNLSQLLMLRQLGLGGNSMNSVNVNSGIPGVAD